MDKTLEKDFDNNFAALGNIETTADEEETDSKTDPKPINDNQSNGFVNTVFPGGDNVDIHAKHIKGVLETCKDDVKVDMSNGKTAVEKMEIEPTITERSGKEWNYGVSLGDTKLANGSGSYTSLEDLELPKYYTPQIRSRKGAQMGSENLITDAVSILTYQGTLCRFFSAKL